MFVEKHDPIKQYGVVMYSDLFVLTMDICKYNQRL